MNRSFDKISLSPLNRSSSKALYSFSKGQRFEKINRPTCEKFYEVKNTFDKRSTSFGFGNKVSMGGRNFVPPPGKYQSKGYFQYNKQKKKGYSFGHDKNHELINEKVTKQIPGPGSYTSRQQKYMNLSFTMRSKPDTSIKKNQKLGPGQYELIGLNETGTYFDAKFRNSGCGKIGKEKRFSYIKNDFPGPGTYKANQKLDLNKEGVYFNSKFQSNPVRTFSRSSRPNLGYNTLTPGPGAYPQFSEFGQKNKSQSKM